jgi:FkbM family methyltransferase
MEDYFLYRYYLNKYVSDGIYVELGAQNGFENSNTLFLERNLGYKGLLIEPAPNQFNLLTKNRSNNFCENYAVHIENGTKMFLGNNACGGLTHTMAETHKNNWHKNQREYMVHTIPIKNLFKKHNINYIDFFSIDVEGGEELVLKSMDWTIPVFIICIELDNQIKKKIQDVEIF